MNTTLNQFEYWKRLPVVAKIIVVILVLAFVTYVFGIGYANDKNREKFYKRGFSSIVVKREDWQGRSNEYFLDNGLNIKIYYSADSTLRIGDSILKNARSYEYKVYRKNNNGSYELYGGFSINRLISDSTHNKGIFNK